jgi:hypothetical protein
MPKDFEQYIKEQTLKQGMVFRTLDKTGDLANKLLFAKFIKGDNIVVRMPRRK